MVEVRIVPEGAPFTVADNDNPWLWIGECNDCVNELQKMVDLGDLDREAWATQKRQQTEVPRPPSLKVVEWTLISHGG